MKIFTVFLILVLGCIPVGPTFSDEFRTGLWILELRRADAPVDTRKINIYSKEGEFVVSSATNNELDNPVTQFVIENNTISFTISEVELDCRLSLGTKQPTTWDGSCPPGATPDSDNTLIVIMRPPIGLDAVSDEETAEASPSDQKDAAAE